MELAAALRSPDPSEYISHTPVHQVRGVVHGRSLSCNLSCILCFVIVWLYRMGRAMDYSTTLLLGEMLMVQNRCGVVACSVLKILIDLSPHLPVILMFVVF